MDESVAGAACAVSYSLPLRYAFSTLETPDTNHRYMPYVNPQRAHAILATWLQGAVKQRSSKAGRKVGRLQSINVSIGLEVLKRVDAALVSVGPRRDQVPTPAYGQLLDALEALRAAAQATPSSLPDLKEAGLAAWQALLAFTSSTDREFRACWDDSYFDVLDDRDGDPITKLRVLWRKQHPNWEQFTYDKLQELLYDDDVSYGHAFDAAFAVDDSLDAKLLRQLQQHPDPLAFLKQAEQQRKLAFPPTAALDLDHVGAKRNALPGGAER